MTKTILFLAANPVSSSRLRLDQEVREIDEGLRRAKRREEFTLEQRWALRPNDLRRALLDFEPEIVHFSGHGVGEQGIVLEDDEGEANLVSTEALKNFFALFPSIKCVILNACYSESQADAIAQHVQYVVGMKESIEDRAAIEFATSFYDALGAGKPIEFAFLLARNAIQLAGLDEHIIPVLKMRSQWVLVLHGTLADLSEKQYESIINYLRQLTEDQSLKLIKVESGSIVLKLEGSKEGFRVMETLYKAGKLTKILGLPIEYIGYGFSGVKGMKPIDVFFSYSHKDEDLRSELVTHLSILERNGVISGWCDHQIGAGEEWKDQIDARINEANIILLLVSSDFIASDYCWNVEVKHAMARHEIGDARVIPVILRPVNWTKAPFSKLQALPRDAKPVTTWQNRDEAFLDISKGIEVAISRLSAKSR